MINRASILTWNEQVPCNMETKMNDMEFLGDTTGLIRPEKTYNPMTAYQVVKELLIDRLQK